MTLLVISIVVLLLIIYAVYGRKWLRKQSWAQWWFDLIEPIERFLYLKSETILVARALMFFGTLSTFLTQIGTIDITPLMPLVPDEWEPTVKVLWNMIPMAVTLLGWFQEQLRKDTTKPIEIVALPEAIKKEDPVVAEAVAKVEEAVAVAKSTAADATGGTK